MRRMMAAIGGTVLGSLLFAASVAAASPTAAPTSSPSATSGGTVASVLGLSDAQIRELRHENLSLAQIAARQKVAVQKVVDALVTQWTSRIQARVANGALTDAQAAQLRTQLQSRAQTAVSSTAPSGMQGAAVGAGPQGASANRDRTRARDGSGAGTGGPGPGDCDGTGPHGPAHH